MKIVLGGKFECAVIRALDAVNRPHRNRSSSSYYIHLNRFTDRSYFERAGTFIAIANEIQIPSVDWTEQPESTDGLDGSELGLVRIGGNEIEEERGYGEWDAAATSFADMLLAQSALTQDSLDYVADFRISDVDPRFQDDVLKKQDNIRREISHHYLCRLLLQIRTAQGPGRLLVLDETDVRIVGEIREFVIRRQVPLPFDFPDLDGKVVLGHEFGGGLLNFAPPSVEVLATIRNDPTIQAYASSIREAVQNPSRDSYDRALLAAMKETYEKTRDIQKVEKAFEISNWVLKPINYLPVVGNVVAIAEDIRDAAGYALQKKRAGTEWHLLAAKASLLMVEDYMRRKGNQ